MTSAKENAIGLYMDGIRDGHPREAVAKYTGDRYTQHSTGVADGAEGFVAFFEPFLEKHPDRAITVIRALQDGSKVFVHAHQVLNGGAARWVTTDFFQSDDAGKIIEHWDVIEADADPNPSGRTKTDGPTTVTDHHKTEANKALVSDFIRVCLIARQLDRVHDFIDEARFRVHNPHRGDGVSAFLSEFTAGEEPLSYQECFMLVGEGNFVATLNRAKRGHQDLCQVDLFRVDNGKIVEHWDNVEPVPPRDQWANSGKF